MKLPTLLQAAEAEGALGPGDAVRAAEFLERRRREEAGLPWYLQGLVAIGAWFSAAFFVVFVGLFLSQVWTKSGTVSVVVSLIVIGATTALRRVSGNVFVTQMCLAVSVAAHLLFFFGVERLLGWDGVVISSFAIAAALYLLYPDALHRFLSCSTAYTLGNIWLFARFWHWRSFDFSTPLDFSAYWQFTVAVLAHLALLGHLFLRPDIKRCWRPLAYATAISLLALLLALSMSPFGYLPPIRWPVSFFLAGALLGVGAWAAGGPAKVQAHQTTALVLVGAALALALLTNGGILAALFFLVLGYALQDRALLAFGMLFLPVTLTQYYYSLALDFLTKSLLLVASGAVLLILGVILTRLHRPEPAGGTP